MATQGATHHGVAGDRQAHVGDLAHRLTTETKQALNPTEFWSFEAFGGGDPDQRGTRG